MADHNSSIADAIRHLEATTRLELAEIERIHELSRDLEHQMRRNAALLARLRSSLANDDRPPASTERARSPFGEIDDRALSHAVSESPSGLAPREIRRHLRIHHSVSGTQLSRALSRAVDRGAVERSGSGAGTRYHVRSEQRQIR